MLLPPKLWPERLKLPPALPVLPVLPRFVTAPSLGRSNEPGRLPALLLFTAVLLAPVKPRLVPLKLLLLPPRCELLLKKCCELDGTLRRELGFAARPDGLKLSREGEIGILPETMLACRNDDSLKRC